MSCKICGRNSCISSFHSIEEQQEHDELYGKYEDIIEELKDKIEELEKHGEIMWNIMTSEQRDEFYKSVDEQ